MKTITFVLFFLISNSLFGQITYEPTFLNQCSQEVLSSQYWTIVDSTKTYQFDWKKVTLPNLGNYQLKMGISDPPIELTIKKDGIIRDTFFTKRITHAVQVSTPPHSEYLDCDNLAEGKIIDYYFSGQPRMKGTFKNGQLLDTLFSYFRSGQLSEIIIPKNKNWKRVKYFKNGKTKSIYETDKKYTKEFYSNGQLKLEENWSKKNKSRLQEFFPNGILKRNQSHKKLEIYNQDEVVVEKMKRKEILIFERLFKKKKHGREKFYEYQWESFDNRGIIKRKIIFISDHFNMNPFPDSLQQIDDFLFEKVIFYFNGKEFKKIMLELESRKSLSRKLVIYRKEGKQWIKEKTTSISNAHKTIETYSN